MCRCTVIHSGKRLLLLLPLPLLAMPREGVGGDIGPHTHNTHTHTHTHTTLNCTSNSYTSLNIAMQAETKCMFRNTQACMQCTHTSAHMLKHIDTHQHMLKHKHAHIYAQTQSVDFLLPVWLQQYSEDWVGHKVEPGSTFAHPATTAYLHKLLATAQIYCTTNCTTHLHNLLACV